MDDLLREQLSAFLKTAQAHMTFADAVVNFPIEHVNDLPPHVEYSPWMLLEHIRIAQKDVLDFMIDPNYRELKWPDDYWPKKNKKADKKLWDETVKGCKEDLEKVVKLVLNPKTDLSAKVEKGTGQTILREILLIIDHTSHHIGEFAILRQVMSTWPKDHTS